MLQEYLQTTESHHGKMPLLRKAGSSTHRQGQVRTRESLSPRSDVLHSKPPLGMEAESLRLSTSTAIFPLPLNNTVEII